MTPAGIEPATFRIVAQHLNHCAIAVPLGSMFLPWSKTRRQSTLEREVTFWRQLATCLVLISVATLKLSVAFLSICVQTTANLKLGYCGSIPQNFQFLIRYFLGSVWAQVWDWTVRGWNPGRNKRFIFLHKKYAVRLCGPPLCLFSRYRPIPWVTKQRSDVLRSSFSTADVRMSAAICLALFPLRAFIA